MNPRNLITPGNAIAHARARSARFPHMGPADSRVWQAHLTLQSVPSGRLDYDVRLGGVGAELVDREHEHFPMWLTLLKKRIDVVVHYENAVKLIEVKPIAGFSALGQALGYCDLWEREKGSKPKPVPCVCCAIVDPDLTPTFERYGVLVYALPRDLAEEILSRPQDGVGPR